MSLILNLDTSIETASVSIARNGIIIASIKNEVQKEHAGFLQPAIKELTAECNISFKDLNAIAVTIGPGSYTGLRVGMASAKGLCYALKKPFITIGTLNALAAAAIDKKIATIETLFCPMIDARRMEVYTSIFDVNMNEIVAPCAMVLTRNSFADYLQNNPILFNGSGALKWSELIEKDLVKQPAFLLETDITESISFLSYKKFLAADFSDLSYSEPLYVKDFYNA